MKRDFFRDKASDLTARRHDGRKTEFNVWRGVAWIGTWRYDAAPPDPCNDEPGGAKLSTTRLSSGTRRADTAFVFAAAKFFHDNEG